MGIMTVSLRKTCLGFLPHSLQISTMREGFEACAMVRSATPLLTLSLSVCFLNTAESEALLGEPKPIVVFTCQ